MTPEESRAGWVAPIFIVVDDDRPALDRLVEALQDDDWFLVPVYDPARAVQCAMHYATTGVILAAPLLAPQRTAERLLQFLLEEVHKPVIVMAETLPPDEADRWRRMGATDCVPHPTRMRDRTGFVRRKLQDLAQVQKAQWLAKRDVTSRDTGKEYGESDSGGSAP